MIVTSIKCDICGNAEPIDEKNPQGWFMGNIVNDGPNIIKITSETNFSINPLAVNTNLTNKHICGLECVHKYVDAALAAPQAAILHKSLDEIDGVA